MKSILVIAAVLSSVASMDFSNDRELQPRDGKSKMGMKRMEKKNDTAYWNLS